MDLTIATPADTESRVLNVLCRSSGHEPCSDQTACAQTELLSMLATRVTEQERNRARQAAAANVPPLTFGG